MACFRPLPAYQSEPGEQPRIGYWAGEQGIKLELPCGHCTGCLMDRRQEWSIRCTHEAQLYDSNLFVSLDYAPEHLPASLSLEYRDVQLWLKRLRRKLEGVTKVTTKDQPNGYYPIRFFLSGEYGSVTRRPHWHSILFNCRFPDQVRLHNGNWQSSQAEDLWGKGRVVIGEVTPQSISYVAGYTTYKMYGRGSEEFYEDVVDVASGEVTSRRPELVSMSRDPGIGTWWYQRYRSDLFGTEKAPHDFAVLQGEKRRVPRFYWKRFCEDGDPFTVEEVRNDRIKRASEVDRSESTLERRAVREEALLRRVRTFSQRKM